MSKPEQMRMPSPNTAPNKGMQATAYSLRLAVLGSGFPPRLMPSVRPEKHAPFRMHEMNDSNESNRSGKIVQVGQVSEIDTALPLTVLERFAQQDIPGLLLQAVIIPGDVTQEGQLIEAVAFPWFKIIEMMQRDPNVIYQLDWRQWEEIIAGAYKQQGLDVVLTPRSNDKSRDVIATSRGVGCIRYFDQVKAYNPNRLVTANDVRALIGVLTVEANVSKGILTTTSDFAPGILQDENIKRLMPYRLELKPKQILLDWLTSLVLRK